MVSLPAVFQEEAPVRFAKDDEVMSYEVASAPTTYNVRKGKHCIRYPSCVIGETGTGLHIVGKDNLEDADLRHIDGTGPSVKLNTANGLTKTQDRVSIMSHAFGTRFDAVALKTSPNAISVGQFCMECNWWFKWPPGKPPYFTTYNGDIVRYYVHKHVPYLDE
eukprot:3682175-Heterocapsa_arctica.AAC.1